MRRIGRIDVPDTLWNALVDDAADDFTTMAFDIAERKEAGLTKGLPKLGLKDSESIVKLSRMHGCIVALIRMRTGDFLSDDDVIKNSKDYNEVLDASQLQGDQIAYKALSSDKQLTAIKNILDSNWPGGSTSLPPPS